MLADAKTRERTEGAAIAVQAKHGDSFSANQVDLDPMYATSFGVTAEPPALPCKNDVLVENGAAAPKSCLSPLEMRSPTALSGLPPAGMASTAMRTIFGQPTLWFCLTEEANSRTSVLYALYYSSFGWINNQQASFWPWVIETKSGQNQVSDPGGSTGCLHACPCLGTWRALLSGEALVMERLVAICSVYWWKDD